eukprot:gene12179-biopygen8154
MSGFTIVGHCPRRGSRCCDADVEGRLQREMPACEAVRISAGETIDVTKTKRSDNNPAGDWGQFRATLSCRWPTKPATGTTGL